MRAYLMLTATIFGLVTLAHLWRIVAEDRGLLVDPFYLALTLLAAGMCLWGLRLLRRPA
ncbi:MAG: hypothetical protein IPI38_07570 [Gemmatimonadetes bacterium]|jgi:hypothetical protein|nr:hypothetical protein [Gemmatimonadota bacterium]MBP6669627.1 hypothetical protein [Gemmatimonadales bacterium]MBK7351292.1 hypothetical protein [Gemmatimonadota bacterium]MBK7715267.1 hypothetical protein [Gemmatimonadota bacterium]MBK7786453.1 hypothetical protein [Gemmatimonadota bacterium]